MRDSDIRQALTARLASKHHSKPDTYIRHELGLCAGRTRVDVAVINGHISGFEIKSDEDKLSRLGMQAELYSRVLDRASLVTTDRYLDQASEIVPSWWGVWLAAPGKRAVRIRNVRRGSRNPSPNPFSVAQLLWRDEGLALLRERGNHGGLSKAPRWFVWERLAETLELGELQAEVRRVLRAREDWPARS
ncbi:sce7726 family protein [Salinispora mooreana]|uniref:sce7726 family protein n=1 Tax=Salinispora mooreana TaxID=999545 RepID=UPI0013A59F04|nr:sce7726 family protein [Salinispora mooreana]